MKIVSLTVASIFTGLLFFSFHKESAGVYQVFNAKHFHQLNTGGASAGNSGAPGESNCTQCHSGSVQSGTDFNVLDWNAGVTNYTPGETYTIQLNLTDASAKNGFQILPLKASDNTAAGTITVTDATRTQITPGSAGKQYIGHRMAGTSVSSWSFDWTAPSTDVGNVVFYVATNKTNSNGQASGDVIRLSQHVFPSSGGSATLTEYQKMDKALKIELNSLDGFLEISFETGEKEILYLNLVNLQGQSLLSKQLGNSFPGVNDKTVELPAQLPSGLYVVHFLIGNKAFSRNILLD
jgi:hypothetical protein